MNGASEHPVLPVELSNWQFVWGRGPGQWTATAQTSNCSLDIIGAAIGANPFGAPPALSQRMAAPAAYALRLVENREDRAAPHRVALIRQLLSEELEPRSNEQVFQEHYVVLEQDEFRKVESNFANLAGKWPQHHELRLLRSMDLIELAPTAVIKFIPAAQRLLALRDTFANDKDRIKQLLSAVFLDKPCSITSYPAGEAARLDLLELLVLLLPEPLRPQLTFATRVFGAPPAALRIAFEDYAPNHLRFDWQQGRLTSSTQNPDRYADEVVELLYGDGMAREIEGRGASAELLAQLRMGGGPAMVAAYGREIAPLLEPIPTLGPDAAGHVQVAWELVSGALDDWRMATGRDTLRTRQDTLLKGGDLKPESWVQTLVETFHQLVAGAARGRAALPEEKATALLINELGPASADRLAGFVKALKDAVEARGSLGVAWAVVDKLIATGAESARKDSLARVRNTFIEVMASQAHTAAEGRELLRLLQKRRCWEGAPLRHALASPALAQLPETARVLQCLFTDVRPEEPVNGKTLAAAHVEMSSDEGFLRELVAQAVTRRRIAVIDGDSLALIRTSADRDGWRKALEAFWPMLLTDSEVKARRKHLDFWAEVAWFAVNIGFLTPEYWSPGIQACACGLAGAHPMRAEFLAAFKHLLNFKNYEVVIGYVLKRLGDAASSELAIVFANLTDLVSQSEFRKGLTLLSARAAQIAGDRKVDLSYGALAEFLEQCASMPVGTVTEYGWVARVFIVGSSEKRDIAPAAHAFAKLYEALRREKLPGEAVKLRDTLFAGLKSHPSIANQVASLSQARFANPEDKEAARRLAADALADAACQLISRWAEDYKGACQSEEQLRNARKQAADTRDDSVSPRLATVDLAAFTEILGERLDKPDEARALLALILLENWCQKEPRLLAQCLKLAEMWAQRLETGLLRELIEQMWPGWQLHEQGYLLMRSLLSGYAASVVAKKNEKKAHVALWSALGFLPGITAEDLTVLAPAADYADKPTGNLVNYLLKGGSIRGCDLIDGCERILRKPLEQFAKNEAPEPRYLTAVLRLGAKQGHLAFLDATGMDWLARFVAHNEQLIDDHCVPAGAEENQKFVEFKAHAEDLRKAGGEALTLRLQAAGAQQWPDGERTAARRLALALNEKALWAQLTAYWLTAMPAEPTAQHLRDALPVEEGRKEAYLQALVDELTTRPAAAWQLALYLNYYKAMGGPDYALPMLRGALRLLAVMPPDSACSLEDLNGVLGKVAREESDACGARRNAYLLVAKEREKRGQHDLADMRGRFRAWLLADRHPDALAGYDAGLAEPALRVLELGRVWAGRQSKLDALAQQPTDKKLPRALAQAISKRGGSSASPPEANAPDADFDRVLLDCWKGAAGQLLKASPQSAIDSTRSYPHTDPYWGVLDPALKHLADLGDAPRALLFLSLEWHWRKYFGNDKQCAEYACKRVQSYCAALGKGAKGTSLDAIIENSLRAVRPQMTEDEYKALDEVLATRIAIAKPVIDVLRQMRAHDVTTQRARNVLELARNYRGSLSNQQSARMQNVDDQTRDALRKQLRDSTELREQVQAAMVTLKGERNDLDALIKLLESAQKG